ncbi:FAD binding domain-containing protein [Phlyctema vagabunda]|uniref:FAD binding domain-containing protein n=1 Tax=Phlyctema vagabunda TaxID=108571 RepID=A0ABR4PV20_9HELO
MAPQTVIVVGAGPSGLLLALLLSKQDIQVQVLESAEHLDSQPRATHYLPPAVEELRRAGVIEDVLAAGFIPQGVAWRKIDGAKIAELKMSALDDKSVEKMVCLPLDHLGRILAKHLERQPTAHVKYGHKVVKLEQNEHSATVFVETKDGTTKMSADFIVGCDGANSQIRRSLFGDWEFPGKTWDQQVIATNVYYDFSKFNWNDSNFIIHPNDWFMAAKISEDGQWRVTYGDIPGLTREEYIKRQPQRFKDFLPGHPDSSEYRITNVGPYKVHQRCAEKFRVGRFLLAADAAHLCNPFGGMGLSGGIIDVGNLFDCLIGIFQGKVDIGILDKYDVVRREKYKTIVDPISTSNFERMWSLNPDTAGQDDPFLQLCGKAANDIELSRQIQLGVNALKHDFTQYYS